MKLSLLAGVSLALLVAAGPVYAQATYPPAAGNGQVSDTSIRPGECVTFSGDGFVPGSPVEVTDNDAAVGTVDAGADGTFSVEVCPSVLGVHILRGSGTSVGGPRVVSAVVNVLSAGLSGTGSNSTVPMVLVGGGLVVAGAAAVVTASRRRRLTIA